jgi:hypothetical protein
MKRNGLGYLVGSILMIAACGSDSPSDQQPYKDAAVDSKDAPAGGGDVLAPADTRDATTTNADVVVPADSKDAPATTTDATSSQTDAVEALALADAIEVTAKDLSPADTLGFVDTQLDTVAVDLGPILDTAADQPMVDAQTADLAVDALAALGFACRNDSDCCIEVDSCMNVAYLYSKAPGAAGAPTIPPPGGMCTDCIPPTIQVRCVSAQCVGQRISGYPSSLMNSHCGYIPLTDGGVSVHQVIDAGTVSTKSVWTCSGD